MHDKGQLTALMQIYILHDAATEAGAVPSSTLLTMSLYELVAACAIMSMMAGCSFHASLLNTVLEKRRKIFQAEDELVHNDFVKLQEAAGGAAQYPQVSRGGPSRRNICAVLWALLCGGKHPHCAGFLVLMDHESIASSWARGRSHGVLARATFWVVACRLLALCMRAC